MSEPAASTGRTRKVRRTDTKDPRRARARALKLLYQADVRGEDPLALLARVVADPRAAALLDDVDPDEAAEAPATVAADHPDADPEHARLRAARARNVAPVDAFTRSLVTGVAERRDELDATVQRFARRWAIGRMPSVDRNALRLGAYELTYETTSPAVVINEIVELAKALSTDDSGRYVNGVLEAIRKELAATPDAEHATPDVEPDPEPEPEPEPEVADVEPESDVVEPESEVVEPEPDVVDPEPDDVTPDPAEGAQQQLF